MDESETAIKLEVKPINRIIRIFASGFVLNGVNAIIGLVKMGVVTHSIEKNLVSNYFICLAIWGWFAVNGESVRQSTRQQNMDFVWKIGFNSFKYEWKFLVPFTIGIIVISECTNVFQSKIRLQDILVTVLFGWMFVYTSTLTGILESRGRIEISNWVALCSSLVSLPFFILVANNASFSILLITYFFLNLSHGLIHGILLSKDKKTELRSQLDPNRKLDAIEFKRVLLLESLPRVLAPLFLAFFSTENELGIYTVLSRFFLIYGIYGMSITPVVSLKDRKFSSFHIDKVLGIIGPLIFIMATSFVALFSGELIALAGSTKTHLTFFDLLSFSLLGALTIFTQPFIASMSNGNMLQIRRKSALTSLMAGVAYFPVLLFLLGSNGAFYALSINKVLYYALLKKLS